MRMLEAFFLFFSVTLTCYAVRVQKREERAWKEQARIARPSMP
jgi:hypothetical protein